MSVWMIIASLLCALGCLLCAMPKHHIEIFEASLSQKNIYVFRALGSLLLLWTLLKCIDQLGASIGVAMFIASLTVAAVVVVLILSYQANRLIPYIVAASIACALVALY